MPDDGTVLVDGPWSHRWVHAGGTRLHVAELGEGPLVLLLHGFPQFWWAWRHQLPAIARAGYRAVAADLRGYGASDKPPHGYDPATLAADVRGLVRALGEQSATVVGHDWGGFLGYVAAAVHPDVVDRLAVLSIAHPLAMRSALLRPGRQLVASRYVAGFQVPLAERRLVADGGAELAALLRRWAGPRWPEEESLPRYLDAAAQPLVARSALEYYRWAVRAAVEPAGRSLLAALRAPVRQPVLQLHGELDRCVLPSTARASAAYVAGPWTYRAISGAGHLLPEEAPDDVSRLLLDWLAA